MAAHLWLRGKGILINAKDGMPARYYDLSGIERVYVPIICPKCGEKIAVEGVCTGQLMYYDGIDSDVGARSGGKRGTWLARGKCPECGKILSCEGSLGIHYQPFRDEDGKIRYSNIWSVCINHHDKECKIISMGNFGDLKIAKFLSEEE